MLNIYINHVKENINFTTRTLPKRLFPPIQRRASSSLGDSSVDMAEWNVLRVCVQFMYVLVHIIILCVYVVRMSINIKIIKSSNILFFNFKPLIFFLPN